MIVIDNVKQLALELDKKRSEKKRVGFVPTMGALHSGHISLVKQAKRKNDVVVVSIFVNPTQFNNKEDLAKYPITIEKDTQMLEKALCDVLFLPSVAEMYPKGFEITDKIDFGFMAATLEGEFRPGHFDGMAQIVEKLLMSVQPDELYMGLKDYQQAMIVGEMIRIRKFRTKLIKCPTKRERDGLAMSTRNARLTKEARAVAVELSKTLRYLKRKVTAIRKGNYLVDVKELELLGEKRLDKFAAIDLEYLKIRDAATLKEKKKIGAAPLVVLLAANVNGVRLIDNMVI
jgi:pantoate--beta-alanine ligase